jgi:excinuclease ABC subunit C
MSTRTATRLTEKLSRLPAETGVYIFRNNKNRIIYIGKAKNLRNRVRSYFQNSRHDDKTALLVPQITDFDLMVTSTEVEALILEANLVKQYRPRYNVNLKDDKHFPYIKVTTNEPFPRVLVVRKLERDGSTYFGPYTSGKQMHRTLEFLCRLFTIRTCNLVIPHPQGKPYKVCLDYHIKRCGGPCEGFQSRERYAELVKAVIMALQGKSQELIDDLELKMNASSEELDFESAKMFREQAEALRHVMIRQNVDVGEVVDRDIVSVAREKNDAVAVVMQIRRGILIGRQDFQLEADIANSDEEVIETFITQYYNHQPNLPEELFLPCELAGRVLVEAWLTESKGARVRVINPKAGKKVKLVDLAAANARLLLDELLIQKRGFTERTSKMIVSLKEAIGLDLLPVRMVCFDISNTGETDAVGSCVFFDNAKPKKSEYRHFRIKGVTGQDDFKMMREIIGRYFFRISKEKAKPPDLVIVDGGKGQLSAAKAELNSLGFSSQAVIGLAKRLEEVYLPGASDPLTISKSSPALILLKRIRDEAHRFAIEFNRKVRSKRTIKSELDLQK